MSENPPVTRFLQALIDGRLRRGHGSIDDWMQKRLVDTTEFLLRELYTFESSGRLPTNFKEHWVEEARRYYEDEPYGLRDQLEYLQVLRKVLLLERESPSPRAVIEYLDRLTNIVVGVFARPKRAGFGLLVLVGFGHLGQKKLTPALKDLLPHTGFNLWIVDRDEPARAIAKDMFRDSAIFGEARVLSPGEVAQELKEDHSKPKIAYIATDTRNHLPAAREALKWAVDVIAIEKPLCSEKREVNEFKSFARDASGKGVTVSVVDHYAFKHACEALEALKVKAPMVLELLGSIKKIVFRMLETDEVLSARGAAGEGVIFDMLPHLFPYVKALIDPHFRFLRIMEVNTWRYEGFSTSETCAHVVLKSLGGIEIDARIGKCMNEEIKELKIEGRQGVAALNLRNGTFVLEAGGVPLDVGGSVTRDLNYGAVIHDLLDYPALEFQSINTGIEVVETLLRIRAEARDMGPYDRNGVPPEPWPG